MSFGVIRANYHFVFCSIFVSCASLFMYVFLFMFFYYYYLVYLLLLLFFLFLLLGPYPSLFSDPICPGPSLTSPKPMHHQLRPNSQACLHPRLGWHATSLAQAQITLNPKLSPICLTQFTISPLLFSLQSVQNTEPLCLNNP